jgi:c-di-GMP-binding flagellar brake protein YcgR
MNFNDLISGVKLELEIYNNMDEVIDINFISQFEWAAKEDVAYIAAPIHEGNIYPVRLGSKLNGYFINKDDLFKCKAIVLDRTVRDNLAYLKIELKGDIEKIQRRQFFRFDYSVPITYRIVTSMNPEVNQKIPFIKTITRDLSGGGLCLLLEEKVNIGEQVECELPVNNEKVVRFFGKVTRSSMRDPEEKYKFEIGVSFRKIEYKDREAVIGFIFEEQRKLRKKGLI